MRIGIFDSGLGGLSIARSIMERLPEYDYLYLGDCKRVPYGNRSQETIHEFVAEAMDYLFAHECQLVILACNTASAESLRKQQQEYLPRNFPDRRILGVIIPTAEAVAETGAKTVGVVATASSIESGAFQREIMRQAPSAFIKALATPLLVPLVENGGLKYVRPILKDYLAELGEVDALVLGCTHYTLLKDEFRALTSAKVISQDELLPEKTADYLRRHPEIESKLGKHGERLFHVTDITSMYQHFGEQLMGGPVKFEKVNL
ncbi:MAG: glutamate racemase [Armatimonadetes bacterium]|nr:glutamate racemase [Armatimonadota bacterium]